MNPYREARLASIKYLDTAAYRLGISETMLKRIESGSIPSRQLIERMARMYRCPNLVNEHTARPIGARKKRTRHRAEAA